MTMRRWTIVGVIASVALWACAALAGTPPGCPEARRHLQARSLAPAEAAARACLAGAPAEVASWTVLAQVLAARGRYDEALTWYERVLVRFPADAEVAAARARTLAWSGRLDEAWRAVQALQTDRDADADVAVFAANLALWRSDFAEAERRYDQVLARWPGDRDALRGRAITRKTVGDLDGAHADWSALCARDPGSDSCAEADDLAERRSWLRLRLGYGRTISDSTAPAARAAGWTLPAAADVRLTDHLRVLAGAEHRVRDFGAGPVGDTFMDAALSARLSPRWSLLAGAGAAAARKFSPRFVGYLEPAAGVGGGAELFLRYTRFDFPSGGAHVLSPAFRWEPSAWVLQGRYFLSLPDGQSPRHAGLARASRAFGRDWSASIGGGGGVGLDYLEIREGAAGAFWNVLATASRRMTWRHQLTLEYVHRRERVAGDRHQQHQLSIAAETRL